jgi:hypothetical protein
MIKLNYNEMTFSELIDTIRECQNELYTNRFTTTQCYNIANKTGKKKMILIDYENSIQKLM